MPTIERVATTITSRFWFDRPASCLRRAVLAWVIADILCKLPYAPFLYSPAAPVRRLSVEIGDASQLIRGFAVLPAFEDWWVALIVIVLSAAILGLMTRRWTRLITAVVYVANENLNSLAWPANDGGDNIISIVLFMMIFVPGTSQTSRWTLRVMANAIGNAAFAAIRFQVLIVYVAAGIYKVSGDSNMWQHGMALYYVLQGPYSTPILRNLVPGIPELLAVITYTVIGLQLSAPFLIWGRMRPLIVSLLVVFHMGIALMMGLLEFGAAMCVVLFAFRRCELAINSVGHESTAADWVGRDRKDH